MTTEQLYSVYKQHPLISTDTRKISAGSMFFALKGEKFDANTFAEQAIDAGAAYAIIDNPVFQHNAKYILVDDVLTALQDLARYHRRQLSIPVIGLTGTNGKTTTKELINSVLSQHFKTLATQGNLNNHIGVPLTVLTINQTHEMAVIEMGANHQKEIELLCSIAQPTHGLITNVGKAHLEGFGGVEGVKKGKGELYDYLKKSESRWLSGPNPDGYRDRIPIAIGTESKNAQGIAFINNDNNILKEMQRQRGLENVVYYGTGSADNNLVAGEIIENSPLLTINWTNNRTGLSYPVKTQLTGAYNLDNILAAICIGVYFGLGDDEINRGVESYQPKNNRSQIVKTATNTLICDYYNANPSSMFVAIENIGKLNAARKVLILGDMFEMGDEAAAEHRAVIEKALNTPVDERIFIGREFYAARPDPDSYRGRIPITIGAESPKDEVRRTPPPPPLLELSPTNRDGQGQQSIPGLAGDNSGKGGDEVRRTPPPPPLLELSPTNRDVQGLQNMPGLAGDNSGKGAAGGRETVFYPTVEDAIAPPLLELSPTNRDVQGLQNMPGLAGDNSGKGAAGGRETVFYPTVEDAIAALKASPIKNSTILIKGSRGMALERLVDLF